MTALELLQQKRKTVKESSILVAVCLIFLTVPCLADSLENTRKAAEQGDAQAQYNPGVRYAEGRGLPRDEAEAVKWYRKATEQGFAWAQLNLGAADAEGRGVPRDEAKAVEWFRKVAEQGDAPGLTHEIGLKKVEHIVVVPGRLLAFAAQTRVDGSVLADQVDSNLPQ